MKRKFIRVVFWGLVISLLVSFTSFGQETEKNDERLLTKPRPCEFNNLILEQANIDAKQNSVLVLVARLGVKDTKTDISKRRLHTARAYLIEYSNLRNTKNVIVAESLNKTRSVYGGIEIYVNGKFFDMLTILPNEILALGPCDSPESDDSESRKKRALLYPWIYNKKQK